MSISRWWIVPAYCLFFGSLMLATKGEREEIHKRKIEYQQYYEKLWENCKSNFDLNNNNVFECAEGAKMVRELGYKKTLPSNEIVFDWHEWFEVPVSKLEKLSNP